VRGVRAHRRPPALLAHAPNGGGEHVAILHLAPHHDGEGRLQHRRREGARSKRLLPGRDEDAEATRRAKRFALSGGRGGQRAGPQPALAREGVEGDRLEACRREEGVVVH